MASICTPSLRHDCRTGPVGDVTGTVRARAPEGALLEVALLVLVELDPKLAQFGDNVGSLLAHSLNIGRMRKSVGALDGVVDMARDGVELFHVDHGVDASGCNGGRSLGQNRNIEACLFRIERRKESRNAAADYNNVIQHRHVRKAVRHFRARPPERMPA